MGDPTVTQLVDVFDRFSHSGFYGDGLEDLRKGKLVEQKKHIHTVGKEIFCLGPITAVTSTKILVIFEESLDHQ